MVTLKCLVNPTRLSKTLLGKSVSGFIIISFQYSTKQQDRWPSSNNLTIYSFHLLCQMNAGRTENNFTSVHDNKCNDMNNVSAFKWWLLCTWNPFVIFNTRSNFNPKQKEICSEELRAISIKAERLWFLYFRKFYKRSTFLINSQRLEQHNKFASRSFCSTHSQSYDHMYTCLRRVAKPFKVLSHPSAGS